MLYLDLVHFQPVQVHAQKGGIVAADALNIASTFFSKPANAVVGVIVMTEEEFSFGCDFLEGGKKVFRALRVGPYRQKCLTLSLIKRNLKNLYGIQRRSYRMR